MKESYKAEIVKSNKVLTAREKIMLKDTTNAISMDSKTTESAFIIKPVTWAIVHVTNEMSESGEYDKIVILDDKNDKYTTGSRSFIEAFSDIADEMDKEEFCIMIYRKDSKKYTGKSFITCSLV